jgi:glycosyltransferase involved in cell wall biosynthesis
MRVTHIVAHSPFREGTGTTCYHNARALIDMGCEVSVYATDQGSIEGGQEALDFYHFMRSWLSIGNAYLTPAILSIKKTDILHLHYPFIFGSELTILNSVFTRTPIVLTYHNDLIGSGVRSPAFWLYNRLLAPIILRKALKIIVTSLDYASTSIFRDTIFKERKADLVELGNGVDVETFRPDVEANFVRQRHGLAEGDIVLLFVSSLDRSHARKGLGMLIDTLAGFRETQVKLVVVGGGDMRSDYEAQAADRGISRRVIFAGRVPQDELPAYYATCDMVVIPSRPPEAFGVALAQGMAAGKAVIGSDIPGVRTLVTNGECGYLIPEGDKAALAGRIQELADNPSLRQQMGTAGRERIIQKYTWDRIGQKLLGVYQQVLRTGGETR